MSAFDSYTGINDLVSKYRRPQGNTGRGSTGPSYLGHTTLGGSWVSPSMFGSPTGGSSRGMTGPQWEDMLMDSLLRDAGTMQGAADRQFGRNTAQIGAYERALGGGLDAIQQGGQAALNQADQSIQALQGPEGMAVGNLLGAAGNLQSMIPGIWDASRQPVEEAMDIARQMRGGATDFLGNIPNLSGDAMAAYQRGEQEYGAYEGAITEFKQDSWSDAEAIAQGIRSSMQDQERMATSSFNPDGTPKTAAQKAQDQYMFGRAAQEQTSQVMSQYAGQIRDNVANMRTQLSGLGMQVAGLRGAVADAKNQEAILRISGLQQLGNAGTLMNQAGELATRSGEMVGGLAAQAAAITAQAEGVRLEYQQLQNGWREFRANILSSLPVTALQLEMTGRKDIATLVQQNPESVISWFESLLGLYSAISAAKGTTGFGTPGGGSGSGSQGSGGGSQGTNGMMTGVNSTGSAIRNANQNNQSSRSGFGQATYTNGPTGAGQTQMPDYGYDTGAYA